MGTESSRKRRRYGSELKTQILAEHRGGITVKLNWPMSASMDLSAWMRELLR